MANSSVTENWMSSVDLATYKFTLYLTKPSIWSDPRPLADDSTMGSKAVIIAESGVTGGYGIDNVMMRSVVTGSARTGGVSTGIIQFDLNEPLAFKLLDRVLTYSKIFGFEGMQSARYVLKVEFMGRNVKTGRVEKYPGVHLMPLVFQQISASVTTQGTVYNIVAGTMTTVAVQETTISQTITVKDIRLVKDFATNLESTLNQVYIPSIRKGKDYDPGGPKTKFKVLFHTGSSPVAALADKPNIRPLPGYILGSLWAGPGEQKVTQSGTGPDDIDYVHETFSPGDNLLTAIAQRILQNVPAFGRWQREIHENNPDKPVPTIKIIPIVEEEDKLDKQTGEPAKTITLVIAAEDSWKAYGDTFADHKERLYNKGIQVSRFNSMPIRKKYAFLYSGENTEVLDFQLTFDNMFMGARYPMDGRLYGATSQVAPSADPITETEIISSKKDTGGYDEYGLGLRTDYYRGPGYDEAGMTDNAASLAAGKISAYKSSPMTFIEDIDPGLGFVEMINYKYDPLNPALFKMTQHDEPQQSLDVLHAIRMQETQNRASNGQEAELTIKGDPYWLGTPGVWLANSQAPSSSIGGSATGEVSFAPHQYSGNALVALTTYNPDDSAAIAGASFYKTMDMISSGVYMVTVIESKFSAGNFTQNLKCIRDRSTATANVAELLDKL